MKRNEQRQCELGSLGQFVFRKWTFGFERKQKLSVLGFLPAGRNSFSRMRSEGFTVYGWGFGGWMSYNCKRLYSYTVFFQVQTSYSLECLEGTGAASSFLLYLHSKPLHGLGSVAFTTGKMEKSTGPILLPRCKFRTPEDNMPGSSRPSSQSGCRNAGIMFYVWILKRAGRCSPLTVVVVPKCTWLFDPSCLCVFFLQVDADSMLSQKPRCPKKWFCSLDLHLAAAPQWYVGTGRWS